MLWLYEIPKWLLGLLIVSGFIFISLTGLILTRGWAQRKIGAENDLANYYLSAVGVFYALLVGLIAVAAWEDYGSVATVVEDEAVSLSELYRDLEGYPPADRDHLRELLRDYVRNVIEKEWPAQDRGEEDRSGSLLVGNIVHQMARFEPATEGQKAIHAEALRELNVFLGLRRQRLQAIDTGLPDVLWTVVLFGAALTIGLTYFFWTENRTLHLLLTGFLSAMIGMVIFVIVALNHPLQGDIGPDSFQEVLTHVMRTGP